MIRQPMQTLADLYLADETAWLDAMAELMSEKRLDELDYAHLKEFLEDMARRDRREVKSRLIVLIAHVLKWHYQKDMRTPSWRATITTQRHDLEDEFATGSALRIHAEAVLSDAYDKAVEWAVDESGLPPKTFPSECPWTLDQLLSAEVLNS